MIVTAVFVSLLTIATAQKCISHQGKEVDWYLQLHLPASLSNTYLYFDSTTTDIHFQHIASSPDSENHPLFNTLTQINTLANAEYLAWNDEHPDGSTTSVRAHSKQVLLFDKESKEGIVIVHSMPGYPAIVDHQVQTAIPSGQRIYGQHFLCIGVSGPTMSSIIAKSSSSRLYVYANSTPVPEEIFSECNSPIK